MFLPSQSGCVAAALWGFPRRADEHLYQRQYVKDAQHCDVLTSTLDLLIMSTATYAAATSWTLEPLWRWVVVLATLPIHLAVVLVVLMPDQPVKPLLRHSVLAMSRLYKAFLGVQADVGFVRANYGQLNTTLGFLRNLEAGSKSAPLLLYGIGLQLPFALLVPVHLIQAVWLIWVGRNTCDYCSSFTQANFANVANFLSRSTASLALLNPLTNRLGNEAAACKMVIDFCTVMIGVVLPAALLFYWEVRHRARFVGEQLLTRRNDGEGMLLESQVDVDSLNCFPAVAVAALLPLTCLIWQVIVLAEHLAFEF